MDTCALDTSIELSDQATTFDVSSFLTDSTTPDSTDVRWRSLATSKDKLMLRQYTTYPVGDDDHFSPIDWATLQHRILASPTGHDGRIRAVSNRRDGETTMLLRRSPDTTAEPKRAKRQAQNRAA